MSQQMSIDTEAVYAAYNKLSSGLEELGKSMTGFLNLITEKSQDNKGQFAIIATLERKMQGEVDAVSKLQAQAEEIDSVTKKYIAMAEEANDDGAFRD